MPNICSYVEMYGIVLYSPDRSLKPGEVGIYWNNDMISTYRPAVCFSAQGISACIHKRARALREVSRNTVSRSARRRY